MANMTFKANLLPNSDLEYSLGSADKRWKIYAETQPQQTKTFTGVIGTANDVDNATFYFGSVRPTGAFTDQWSITYRVNAIAAGDSRAKAFSILTINGHADTYSSYAAWNAIYNTSYRPCYYHVYYRLKEAGFNNNYGHALGLRLYSGWNAAVAANARTITIDILDTYNCTFEFYGDTMLKYSAIPGTGSTNYSAKSEFDFCNNGLKETGDDNTTEDGSIYISAKTGAKGIWQTGLVMEDGNGTYQNICLDSSGGVTRTTATTKIPNPNGFRVGGTIWFSNGNYAANTNITGWLNMYNEYSAFDSRYTLNTTLTDGSLTAYAPIYLVGTINLNDGLYYLDNPWWTQTPNNTSKIYVLVGGCYDSTTTNCRMTLYQHNPWYRYDGTRLQPYETGEYLPLSGGTMTGAIYTKGLVGTQNIDYGPTLPASAIPGQLFFQTTNTVVYSVPAGGEFGQVLTKESDDDGDFIWDNLPPMPTMMQVTEMQAGTATTSRTVRAVDLANTYLQKAGGTMTGAINTHGLVGTSNIDYGDTLPATGVEGQIFLQTSDALNYTVPSGGTTGYVLMKLSNTSGDYDWQQLVVENYDSMSVNEIKGGTATTLRALTSKNLHDALATLGGNGLTFTHNSTTGIVLDHTNNITAKTGYGATATTANAAGGSITLTDIKYDAQGHITASQDRTISLRLVQGYGDTTSPYASKTKNYVLAAPSGSNGVPSFRQLGLTELSGADDVKAIEALTGTTGLLKKTAANTWALDTSAYVTSSGVTQITAGAGLNTSSADTSADGGNITATGTLYLTKTGVTAATYGSSAIQTPAHGATFNVPYFTVDKYGRITSASAAAVQLPNMDFSSADFLPLAGGTMTGAINTRGLVGTSNIDYGDTLPATAVEGQVFFQIQDSEAFDIDKVYPIGTVYMNMNSTNPSALFGGTWQSMTNSLGVYMWQRLT